MSVNDSALEAGRGRLDRAVVRVAGPFFDGIAHHWLAGLNGLIVVVLAGAVAAPILMAAGLISTAQPIYDAFRSICHQWAFRSFFLFGPEFVYGQAQLAELGLDPYRTIGSPAIGWKMAFCERDLAIMSGLLLFGTRYASAWRLRGLGSSGYVLFALLSLPMALDGGTQLLGMRESSWALRLATGLLFGCASAWLLYPRFEASLTGSDRMAVAT